MRVQKQRLTCQACLHVFDGEIVVDAPVSVAAASLEALRCPNCGGACSFGGNYEDAPGPDQPLAWRVGWWRRLGEHGISSETIFAAFAGGRPRRVDVPHDPDDFRRCRQLLDLIPEWRGEIARLAEVFPWFKPFTERWDDLDLLYDREAPSGRCPQLFALMQQLDKQAQDLRGPDATVLL